MYCSHLAAGKLTENGIFSSFLEWNVLKVLVLHYVMALPVLRLPLPLLWSCPSYNHGWDELA